jgi:S-adenosylmethionine/arginine decarboxylase-like enzyme
MCGAADSNRALAVLLDAFAPVRQHIETTKRGALA